MAKKTQTLKDLRKRGAKEKGEKISKTKKENNRIDNITSRDKEVKSVYDNMNKGFSINMKKLGRPTKFDPKFAKDMLSYFNDHVKDGIYDTFITEEFTGKFGDLKKKIERRAKPIPTLEGYALTIGVDEHTLKNRAMKRNDDGKIANRSFFTSYKMCLTIQQKMLKELSLVGLYNSNIAKLLLSADHSIYEEREDQENSKNGKIQKEINDEDLDAVLGEFYD